MEDEVKPIKISLMNNIRLKHVGTLDLSEFYRWASRWFRFEGYSVHETQYLEEIEPGGKNYKIIWECEKNKTPYFVYYMELRWLLLKVNKIEIQKGTDKVRVESGDFEIRMDAVLNVGPKPDDFLSKHEVFRKIYENFLIRNRIEEMKLDLYDKAYTLQEDIKKYFNQAAI